MKRVTVLGEGAAGGAYLLRICVLSDVMVRFGRFQRGEPVWVPAGEMAYLGSAMGGLASRVLRHALRSGEKPRHALYVPLLAEMREAGLVSGRFRPPSQKKLHWHIDYLLDETAVALTHAILIRAEERLEEALGEWLLAQRETAVLLPGLGASDVRGQTHLMKVQAGETWWAQLVEERFDQSISLFYNFYRITR
jgi:Uri superfamily endonuclease